MPDDSAVKARIASLPSAAVSSNASPAGTIASDSYQSIEALKAATTPTDTSADRPAQLDVSLARYGAAASPHAHESGSDEDDHLSDYESDGREPSPEPVGDPAERAWEKFCAERKQGGGPEVWGFVGPEGKARYLEKVRAILVCIHHMALSLTEQHP